MLQSEKKRDLIERYATKEGDTGSADVQVAILSERISGLTEHLKANKHDHSTRRALLRLTGRRRKLLRYIESNDASKYRELVSRLGLRR